MWILRYVAAISPSASKTTQVFESFSRPSRRSTIDPPTSVIPCCFAHALIAPTVSPESSGSATSRMISCVPIPFHFSGRRTRSAPVVAARATSGSIRSRFSDFEPEEQN